MKLDCCSVISRIGPRTQCGQRFRFANLFGPYFNFSWDPLRKRNFAIHVMTGGGMFLADLGYAVRCKSLCHSYQGRPKASMDQSDFPAYQPANEYIL